MNTTFIRTVAAAGLVGATALGLSGLAHAEMFGDPDGMAGWTVAQSYDDCAIMSAADVIGQMTGDAPEEDDIVAFAAKTPSVSRPGDMVYDMATYDGDPNAGSIFEDLPIVLEHYGVHSRYVDGASLGALEQVLGNDGAVVVSLNAETIWHTDGDRTVHDHAVVVTGVDTDTGVVHLNDSGTQDGADEQVSIDTFTTAWQTSGNAMVATI
ncbi:C39 family peptidase [Mycolicibacterium sp. S2-37]|uniref:C39 family peptidase n=1 Tax=Mycolicibacterium sp. S2-37 TaxID=2810297 RepID=UPI001A94FC7E|nr:C39 family peptidase [Mycolicibacterium sp. S2-37]MBO0678150.1 C39 family peptidase [Mycolicibacterium sp. S2-37]